MVVAGQSEEGLQDQTSVGEYDVVIMELNSQGTLLWLFQTGTSQADYAHAVQVDSSGDIVLAGHSLGSFEGYTTAGGFDMVVLKIGKPTTTTTTTSSAISSAKNASTSLTSTSSSSWTTLTFTPGSPEAVGAAVSAALKSLATAQAEFAELILESASDGLQREVQDAHGQSIVGVAFEVTGSDMMFENDGISVHLAAASLPRVGNLAVISTAKVHGGGMLAKLIQAYNGAAGAAQLAEPVSLHISAAGPSSTSVPMQLTMPITNGSDEFVQKACVAWDVSTDTWTTDGVALNASDDFSVTCSIWLSFGENVSGRRLDALQPSLFSYISPSLGLNESFPPAPNPEGQEVPWAVVLPIVAGIAVVIAVLALLLWKFRRKRARIEQDESLRETGSAVEAVAVSPDAEAPVDRDQMIRSFVKKEEAVDCDAVSIREEDKAAKTVKKARLAMVSARFNARNRDVEQKFRRVCQILRARDLEVLMVNAGGAQDVGDMTMEYLQQLKEKNGVMLAVCTSDYAERTKSPYSSHAELKYALDNRLDILPLKVEATYPPEPPWGEDHPFDKKGIACGLVSLAIPSSKVFVDCIGQADVWIADEIENVLRSSSELARGLSGHGTKSELGSTAQ
ncbi:CACNA1A [Symbiodinium necroappetens]|uniref:CACNA1A protein n=1 Tax=Symbiodinium necroappetens TaxID=1628268 RepID=A0A812W225_9DINO|nr:CACNA1A [Symbiodinium necroappetens]